MTASKFPSLRTNVPGLERVVRAWSLSDDQHLINPGTSEERIRKAETILGVSLPLSLRAAYEITDGAEFVHGNLMMDPLLADAEELCLARNSYLLRSWGWGIPPEIVVFGSDGSDSLFGVWLPPGNVTPTDAPVIEIGAPDDEMRYMALAGCSFAQFATARTAFYLLHGDSTQTAALDALELPANLREVDPGDDTAAAIFRWADPHLPHHPPDPFEAPVSLDWLRQRFQSGA